MKLKRVSLSFFIAVGIWTIAEFSRASMLPYQVRFLADSSEEFRNVYHFRNGFYSDVGEVENSLIGQEPGSFAVHTINIHSPLRLTFVDRTGKPRTKKLLLPNGGPLSSLSAWIDGSALRHLQGLILKDFPSAELSTEAVKPLPNVLWKLISVHLDAADLAQLSRVNRDFYQLLGKNFELTKFQREFYILKEILPYLETMVQLSERPSINLIRAGQSSSVETIAEAFSVIHRDGRLFFRPLMDLEGDPKIEMRFFDDYSWPEQSNPHTLSIQDFLDLVRQKEVLDGAESQTKKTKRTQ